MCVRCKRHITACRTLSLAFFTASARSSRWEMVAVKAGCQYWKEQDDEALACRMTMPSRKRMEGGCLCDEVHCPSQRRPGLHLHFCSQLSCSPSCQMHLFSSSFRYKDYSADGQGMNCSCIHFPESDVPFSCRVLQSRGTAGWKS